MGVDAALVVGPLRGRGVAGVSQLDAQPDLARSLSAEGRCARTGGTLVCIGHWDYYGAYMVWTRHFHAQMRYRVVPYDHPAPEHTPVLSLN